MNCDLMKWILLIFVIKGVWNFDNEMEAYNGKPRILSRKRRYVTFPEGSSFSCAGCLTTGVIGQPSPTTAPGTFTLGMNWGIAYELPNATETLTLYHRKYKLKGIAQRRNRRDLYQKLELILENIGYKGRDCILKTLCETKHRIIPKGANMIEEMFRTLFTMPLTKVLPVEPLEHTIYDSAHRLSVTLDDCDVYDCPISLVDLAKGYYNAPAPQVDIAKQPWALFSSSFE
ncbi:unnamed protein product [Chilo suppressalis]|uniref:Uncharacterized protein n=1 Tax=Chilo suppressalis TaxID=168631 RepID=A0ABN8B1Q0_CHISP|nr:hypothetical protein evm_007703 [Chilo suppressalis]CAH0399375.1 unnamed protein product [Chilo suppressalis]